CEPKASGSDGPLDYFSQTRLINRHDSPFQVGDLFPIDVASQDLVSQLREAGGGDQADVADAENGKFHWFIIDQKLPGKKSKLSSSVDLWGIEPQPPPCHGGVIPFYYRPCL